MQRDICSTRVSIRSVADPEAKQVDPYLRVARKKTVQMHGIISHVSVSVAPRSIP